MEKKICGNCKWGEKLPFTENTMVRNYMTRKAIPIIHVEDGVTYCSLSEAARSIGGERHCLKKSIINKSEYMGGHWKYAT